MLDRYLYINPELAESLICQSYNNNPIKNDDTINKYYNIKNYIIAHKNNILLADNKTLPTEEYYFDVMNLLMKLYDDDVFVQPILGYAINEQSIKTTETGDVVGTGYVVYAKQKGEPLYLYNKMPNPFNLEDSKEENKKIDYLLETLTKISKIQQEHYDKFAEDLQKIIKSELIFDAYNQSNILYNKDRGFIFTNINFKQSSTKSQEEYNRCFIRNCLSLCCINFEYTQTISDTIKNQLKNLNKIVYEKCLSALYKLNINSDDIEKYSINIWKN